MANNQRTGEYLKRLFEILAEYPDGLPPKKAIAELEKSLPLTDYENGNFESGGRRFDKMVRFGTIKPAKAGWIIKDGIRWILTPAGKDALKKYNDPLELFNAAQSLYNDWKHKYNQSESEGLAGSSEEDEDESEQSASVTFEEAKEQAQEKIDAFLHNMEPYEFQKLIADLLNAMGYHVIWIAPPGKDGGMDILAYTDPLGAQGPRIKVQVKQQQKPVTEPDLKSFMANIGQHDSGIFFCTGGFTQDAHKFARNQESRRIMLVDSIMLVKLWTNNIKRLSDQAWQRLPLTPVYFLTPEN